MTLSDLKYLLQSIVQLPKAIKTDGIFKFLIISGIASLLLGIIILGIAWVWGDNLGVKLMSIIPWINSKDWSETLGIWLGRILVLATGIILYKHLIINITSQFLGGINDKIMAAYKENLRDFYNPSITRSIQRGVRLSIRNLFLELSLTLMLILLGTIFPILFVTSPLLFLIQSYYAGFGMTDLFLEKYMSSSDSIQWNKNHKILTTGIGAIFMGLLFLPILGLMIAPGLAAIISSRAMVQMPEFNEKNIQN